MSTIVKGDARFGGTDCALRLVFFFHCRRDAPNAVVLWPRWSSGASSVNSSPSKSSSGARRARICSLNDGAAAALSSNSAKSSLASRAATSEPS